MTETYRKALNSVAGVSIWVVGGAVRDWALRRPFRDLDIGVEGDVASVGGAIADASNGHFFVMHPASQTARVAFQDGTWLDIVPLLHGLETDLKRRDFTVNAMAVPLAVWLTDPRAPDVSVRPPAFVVDPTGGWGDLGERLIRVTNPSVFTADPLRTLRGLRLLSSLGGARMEQGTMALLREAAPLLSSCSPERQRDELLLMMDVLDSGRAVELAADVGLLDQLVPQWSEMDGVSQNPYHHLDVWGHTLAVLRCFDASLRDAGDMPAELRGPVTDYLAECATPPRTRRSLVRLAILLHDIGKPETRTEDDEGRIRFLSHEHASEAVARAWAVAYRLSGRERAFLGSVVGLHMRVGGLLAPEVSKRAIVRFFRDAGPAAPALLLLNVADRLAARGPWTTNEDVETQVEGSWRLLRLWVEMRSALNLPLPVSGRDIMAGFGLGPGPRIGRIIQALRDVHADTPFRDREAALEAAAPMVEDLGEGMPTTDPTRAATL